MHHFTGKTEICERCGLSRGMFDLLGRKSRCARPEQKAVMLPNWTVAPRIKEREVIEVTRTIVYRPRRRKARRQTLGEWIFGC